MTEHLCINLVQSREKPPRAQDRDEMVLSQKIRFRQEEGSEA